MSRNLHVAIVGATGAVGIEMMRVLEKRNFPVGKLTLLASGRLMYHGPREGITPWFGSLGYHYDPNLHGVPSDW